MGFPLIREYLLKLSTFAGLYEIISFCITYYQSRRMSIRF
jgi:hypothetical protein